MGDENALRRPGSQLDGQARWPGNRPKHGRLSAGRGIFLEAAGAILKDRELITYYKREAFRLRASQSVSLDETPDAENPETVLQAVATFTVSEGGGGVIPAKPKPPSKLKYSCPDCHANAWGKPGLDLICGACWDGKDPVRLVSA